MENVSLVLNILILAAALAAVFLLARKSGQGSTAELLDMKNRISDLKVEQARAQTAAMARQQELFNQSQTLLSAQLETIMARVGDNMNRTQGNITEQLKVIGEVQKKLGILEETAKNMQEIGKDIASLQDILSAPKLRGNLGELLLEDLLKQIFPRENYETQKEFKNGGRVDAVIKLAGGMVPIDAKFPMESFKRYAAAQDDAEKSRSKKEFVKSVKLRIDEIAARYINPDEGTFNFAMMYVPAENVFYETVISDALSADYEVLRYAIAKNVVLVSPNSFYAYLTALVYGLRGFRIEEKARVIMGELSHLEKNFSDVQEKLQLTGKHLKNAGVSCDDALKHTERFGDRLGRVTGSASSPESAAPKQIE
ncbi:MAG: DNA recombination protein RmuC [Elusimicrobiota bacterium]